MRVSSRYSLFSKIRPYNKSVSRPDVIFLPGMLCDQRMWFEVARMIEPHANPITLDLNHCKTIDDACEFITRSSSNVFCLVGFSMGGYIAQEYVLRNQEKVSHLVLAGAVCVSGFETKLRINFPSKLSHNSSCL